MIWPFSRYFLTSFLIPRSTTSFAITFKSFDNSKLFLAVRVSSILISTEVPLLLVMWTVTIFPLNISQITSIEKFSIYGEFFL